MRKLPRLGFEFVGPGNLERKKTVTLNWEGAEEQKMRVYASYAVAAQSDMSNSSGNDRTNTIIFGNIAMNRTSFLFLRKGL